MHCADAVIIAGGKITNPTLRRDAGVDAKALIDVGGRPLVGWVVEALRASESIGQVALVGGEKLDAIPVDCHIPEGKDEVDNLVLGIQALGGSERVLMVAGDMALLTPEAVDDLVGNAPQADVVFPVVERGPILAQFPSRPWVFIRLPEGKFTGASCFLFNPGAVIERRQWLQRVFDARRNVMELARMWGAGFVMKYLMGVLHLSDIERQLSETLGLSGRAYISRYPELAFDVDKPGDIAIARARLETRDRRPKTEERGIRKQE